MSDKKDKNKVKKRGRKKSRKEKEKGFDIEEVKKRLRELRGESGEGEEGLDLEGGRVSREKDNNWYAIRCMSGREKKIAKYMMSELKRLGYGDWVEKIIVPAVRSYRNIRGKRQLYDKILMPGYILYKGKINADIVHIVNTMTDVRGFVGGNRIKLPSPMKPEEVRRILSAMYSDIGSVAQDDMTFVVGEVVRIVEGPFEGFQGRVEEVESKRKRLKVIINIFGRDTTVDLNFGQVQKI